jgi:hypothetical protein
VKQSWYLIALLALCTLSFAYLIGLKHGREENNPPKHSKSASIRHNLAAVNAPILHNAGTDKARNVPFLPYGAAQPAFPPLSALPSL